MPQVMYKGRVYAFNSAYKELGCLIHKARTKGIVFVNCLNQLDTERFDRSSGRVVDGVVINFPACQIHHV